MSSWCSTLLSTGTTLLCFVYGKGLKLSCDMIGMFLTAKWPC